LHLIGLLSDGNVHSHIEQLFALIRRAREDGVERLFVHPLLDGRDVPETSALEYVDALEGLLESMRGDDESVVYSIASGGGRMKVTMDRYEADWEVVERGWRAHVLGEGRFFPSARVAIETYRREDSAFVDQFLPPFVIGSEGEPIGPIQDGDSVVFFNFRGDRALEISRAFEEEGFDKFDRVHVPDVLYAGMMQYDGDLHIPNRFLVEPPDIERTLTNYLSALGKRQLACAETQKYGHVTYFWNGNNTGIYDPEQGKYVDVPGQRRVEETYSIVERSAGLEKYLEVPSDKVPFEQRPWMKAAEVTDAVLDTLSASPYDVVRLNYANGDMVGHTGDLQAAILAVEATDLSLGRLLDAVADLKGVALVTADHGNSDQMYEVDKKTGKFKLDDAGKIKRKTSHTLNPVFFIVYDSQGERFVIDEGLGSPGLANVAATILTVLGLEAPEDYEPSLIIRKD